MISILVTVILCIPPIVLVPSSFGLRLDYEHIAQIIDIKLRFRIIGIGIAILTTLCALIEQFPLKLLTPALFILLSAANWALAYTSVKRRKLERNWLDDEETKVWEAGYKLMLPVLTLPIYLYVGAWLTLFLAANYLHKNWDSVPWQVPIHFDPGFKTNSWSPKNIGSVYFLTFIGFALSMVFLLISLFIRLPSFTRGKAFRTSHVATLVSTIHALSWLQCFIIMGFAVNQVAYLIPELQNYQQATSIGSLIICILAFVLGCIYVVRQTGRYEHAARELFADQTNDDDKQFYILGIFYYNPKDERVIVNNRFGVGLDFNWARWQSLAFVLVVIIVAIAAIIPALN